MTQPRMGEGPDGRRAGSANWRNRTLFHGDNLRFLRAMNSESVDLIATDPPFNKSRDFHATPDSLAAGASFQDRWSWEKDVHPDWVDRITDDYPRLMEAIESARYAHSDGMGAFMCFMAVRLLEMHRLLKPTGSIYLHCDPTASHYLKAVMDAILGWKNFRNEIIWERSAGRSDTKSFARIHDGILYYSKSSTAVWNQQYEPLTRDYIGRKFHLSDSKGIAARDVITDINRARRTERTGYPTQKPLALYERLILASSNKGDIVLDPFAGCATTCIAAEKHGRQWVGIDIWDKAHEIVVKRLKDEGLLGEAGDPAGHLAFGDLHYTKEPPARTDGGEAAAPFLRAKVTMFEPRGPKMSRAEMYRYLLGQHGPKCQGCDRVFDDPRYLELDHNTPRSDGGLNHISNRILLCGPCNRLKSNTYTLSGLRRENARLGYMAESVGEHPLMREIREERENRPPGMFD